MLKNDDKDIKFQFIFIFLDLPQCPLKYCFASVDGLYTLQDHSLVFPQVGSRWKALQRRIKLFKLYKL